jgi:hypothetical protein
MCSEDIKKGRGEEEEKERKWFAYFERLNFARTRMHVQSNPMSVPTATTVPSPTQPVSKLGVP